MKNRAQNPKSADRQHCVCPFCEAELALVSSPLCKNCGVELRRCVKCKVTVLDKDAKKCPSCGEPLT
jgi:hypothetical protein